METDLTKHEAGEIFIKWGPTYHADNRNLYSLDSEEMAAVKEAVSEAMPDQVQEENIDSKLLKASASDGLEMYLEIICLEIICLEIICLVFYLFGHYVFRHVLAQGMIGVQLVPRPNRGPMLTFLAGCKTLNATEFFLGICTWALTLRLGCKKVQLPAALRVVETIERPWP